MEANKDKPWYMNFVSLNPTITFDIVDANLDKQWNYSYLCINPNITYEYIINNTYIDWEYKMFAYNKMSKHSIFNNKLSYVLK